MTRRQMSILRKIRRHKNLNKIIQKTKVNDYLDLQMSISTEPMIYIAFSDDNMDENTEVYLTSAAIEILERYSHNLFWKILTAVIAIATIATTIYIGK